MSSSSATVNSSRSPSPSTPEASDSMDSIAIHNDLELSSSWFLSMDPAKSLSSQPSWDIDPSLYLLSRKSEDDKMLRLDELIEQHAYDDSPSPIFPHSPPEYPSLKSPQNNNVAAPLVESVASSFQSSNLVPQNGTVSSTKPIPPPASLPRRQDPSLINQKVVHPPKESCYNLPIMFPSIPEGGTKSRVETQVRVTVDLADASSSSDPHKYDRVGSWKWLKLPQGTATKKRTRKQGKIDPEPQDILHLSATITCASPPHNRVLSCSSCQAREAKRVAKKVAARVRPARSDSDSCEDPMRPKSKQQEDTTSIVQFNCAEVLDFSTGSVVLPLRITCYCRHHREKVGFNVHLTMMDHSGRIVGTGSSKPIMITDDHKTASGANSGNRHPDYPNGFTGMDSEWAQVGGAQGDVSSLDTRAPSKRKKDLFSSTGGKKRPKPYDSATKPNRGSREGSLASVPSPSTTLSTLPATRSPTPLSLNQQFIIPENLPQTQSSRMQPHSSHEFESISSDICFGPHDQNANVHLSEANSQHTVSQHTPQISLRMDVPDVIMPVNPHPIPFMFFDQTGTTQPMPPQVPTIHRLIPNVGPTHGGIEVTVLGANFHASLQLNCIFGDVAASCTQRWSDNTLVCMLPPRALSGVVAVWLDGFPKTEEQGNIQPSLFTYTDESDRALMELALQVVGLKMTGKIEDAKNVAMRIVGNVGGDTADSQNGANSSDMMQLSSVPSVRDIRPLLVRANDTENFEGLILNFLAVLNTSVDSPAANSISIVKAISYPTSSGQTLLHLAVFMKFASLTRFLIHHEIDVDARDRNGYTALHFAVLSKSKECTRLLLEAGADREIVNGQGKTPEELADAGFFDGMLPAVENSATDSDIGESQSEDEEAEWGDAEEDADVQPHAMRRGSRRSLWRGGATNGDASLRKASEDISRIPTPLLPSASKAHKNDEKMDPDIADAKQTASFVEMIQRTLAQFPAPHGMIPNMPQLPLPHLPHLLQLPGIGMPAVPWGALPQIPMVFPVFVPMMPGWPSFFGGEQPSEGSGGTGIDKVEGEDVNKRMGGSAIRTAQEWRATWEKWVALAVATTARQQTEDVPPPMYTPRAAENDAPGLIAAATDKLEGPSQLSLNSDSHRAVYNVAPAVTEQEVNDYGYQPAQQQTHKLQKKHDRMLLYFWLPILLISLLWAFHNGLQFAFQTLKTSLPLKSSPIHN